MEKYDIGKKQSRSCQLTVIELCKELVNEYEEKYQNDDKWRSTETLWKLFKNDDESGLIDKLKRCLNFDIEAIAKKSNAEKFDELKLLKLLYYKEKKISVYFEKENINSLDSKGEILLTIMASLAQQESESLSKNVKLGLQFRYQNGEVQVNHKRFRGYTKDDEGHLIIEPAEAEVVKRIYLEYLQESSLKQIGESLESDVILTAAGKAKWRPETIKKILKNEKYIGDALLQKIYTVDVLTKKRVKNNGIVPQYYVENSHEAIIPRDLYMQVQEEMLRRTNLHSGANRKKRVYSSKYALSSIVYCPKCGDIYRRIAWNNRGKHSFVWRCVTQSRTWSRTL